MARKGSKRAKSKTPAKRGRSAAAPPAKRGRPAAAQVPAPSEEESRAAAQRSARSLEAQGQAVPEGQPLPPGATHEIVGREADGTPMVKRKRFSAH